MRATGIVRRIDDLGRIIIPKEIRRVLGIKEGDPMEIYVDKDTVIFKKYNEIPQLSRDEINALIRMNDNSDLNMDAQLRIREFLKNMLED